MSDAISDEQGRGQEDPDFDPRDTITPHAFEVDQSLLGTPLAAPWQRLVAFLMDLAIAGFIANVAGGLVSIVVVYVFYRLATQYELDAAWKRWARGCLVTFGAILLFGLTIALVEDVEQWGVSGPSLQAFLPGVQPDTTEVQPQSPEVPDVPEGREVEQDLETLKALSDADDLGDLKALEKNLASPPPTLSPEQDSKLLRQYAEAVATRDSARLDSLTAPVQALVAGSRLDHLETRIDALEQRNSALEDQNKQLRTQLQSPSLQRMIRATANDFGITIGWVGLYFTLFLAWWQGRTPGKYLLGIRVVRLTGEPLSLWYSFERFGGYAAGIATGLLGFVQLYWDPNRQGIHDRIARTVVIQTRT